MFGLILLPGLVVLFRQIVFKFINLHLDCRHDFIIHNTDCQFYCKMVSVRLFPSLEKTEEQSTNQTSDHTLHSYKYLLRGTEFSAAMSGDRAPAPDRVTNK